MVQLPPPSMGKTKPVYFDHSAAFFFLCLLIFCLLFVLLVFFILKTIGASYKLPHIL